MATGKDDKQEKTEKQQVRENMKAAAENDASDEPKYHVDEHIELAYQMYGEASHVIAGAIELAPGNKKYFTKSEMSAAIDAFNKHTI